MTRALVATALVAIAVTALTVSRTPLFSINPLLRVRYVWMVGAFAWFALAIALVRLGLVKFRLGLVKFRLATRPMLAGVLAGVVVLGGVIASTASKGVYHSDAEPSLAVSALSLQLRHRMPHDRPFVLRAVEPVVGFGVMWDLVRHGFDVRAPAEDPYFGPDHGPPRDRTLDILYVLDRVTSFAHPAGSTVIASYGGTHEHEAQAALQRLCRRLTESPPVVTAAGRASFGKLPPNLQDAIRLVDAGHLPECTAGIVPTLGGLFGFRLMTSPGLTVGEVAHVQALFDDVTRAGRDVVLAPGGSAFGG